MTENLEDFIWEHLRVKDTHTLMQMHTHSHIHTQGNRCTCQSHQSASASAPRPNFPCSRSQHYIFRDRVPLCVTYEPVVFCDILWESISGLFFFLILLHPGLHTSATLPCMNVSECLVVEEAVGSHIVTSGATDVAYPHQGMNE